MTSADRIPMIEQRLCDSLAVAELEVLDESHLHRGHPGAAAGGGHYRVRIVSEDFAGRSRIQRHRMVYAALGEAMRADTIHALSVTALTPEEAGEG